MGKKESTDVGLTGELGILACLEDINTIKGIEDPKLFNRRLRFHRKAEFEPNMLIDVNGNGGVGTGEGKVINLTKEQDALAFDGSLVDVTFMGS